MAQGIKKLYRQDNRVIAGVCAGIAEYCDIDPVVVRILVVLLTISSLGIVALMYVLLWLVMPRRLNITDSISCDVRLQTDFSDTESVHGTSEGQSSLASQESLQAESNKHNFSPYGAENRVEAVEGSDQRVRSVDTTYYEAATHRDTSNASYQNPYDNIGRPARMLVWMGVFLLFAGFTGLCSAAIEEVHWWQLWPCFMILGGVVIIALPSSRVASFIDRFFYGVVILAVGLLLLLITLHILSWRTVPTMLSHLWPILIILLGVGVIACSLKSKLLAWVVALGIVATLVAGVVMYALPGPLEYITVHTVFFGVQVFDVNPWV